MNREIKTDLDNILSLISCARTYGHENGVLFDAFSGMIGRRLDNDDIERYSRSVGDEEGYGEEDYEDIKNILTEFKLKFCDER